MPQKIKTASILKSCLPVFSGCLLILSSAAAQEKVIDRIVGVVGKNIILQSELEVQYNQYLAQGNTPNPDVKCEIMDQMLLSKLMINQAELDSVDVPESQVEGELDRRIRYFVSQIGSEQKLEEYYKKSIAEIKAEFRETIKDQLLAQTIQSKITKDVNASPSDVRAYFERIPVDSLPYINAELEIAQVVKYPVVSAEEKRDVKEELERIRQKIMDGTDFGAMAGLYSQDPGSAKRGGELGFVSRGDLVPEFEAAAFALKGTEISKVFESKYGYHIVQLIERRGAQINVRHILLKPKMNSVNLAASSLLLDSIAKAIRSGSISFAEAAQRFSDDEETRNSGGVMVNGATGTTRFEPDQLDPTMFFQVDKMMVGEVSAPTLFQNAEGSQGYRLLLVKSRTEPHHANLKDDYQRVQNAALTEKQNNALLDWVKKKKATTYIHVDDDFRNCEALQDWFN